MALVVVLPDRYALRYVGRECTHYVQFHTMPNAADIERFRSDPASYGFD